MVISSPVRAVPRAQVRLTVGFGYGTLLMLLMLLHFSIVAVEADASGVDDAPGVLILPSAGAPVASFFGGGTSTTSSSSSLSGGGRWRFARRFNRSCSMALRSRKREPNWDCCCDDDDGCECECECDCVCVVCCVAFSELAVDEPSLSFPSSSESSITIGVAEEA